MARKAPRRTAERILEAALDLFNRLGEPNVSTTAIAAHLGISPGNLYYHYPAKEEIVNALSQRHAQDLREQLQAAGEARDVAAACTFVQALLQHLWEHRFVYRDINDLMSRNRALEDLLPHLLHEIRQALVRMLRALQGAGVLEIDAPAIDPTVTNMLVVLTYWASFEFVQDPRGAQDPRELADALRRGAGQVLHALAPYLQVDSRKQLPAMPPPRAKTAAAGPCGEAPQG